MAGALVVHATVGGMNARLMGGFGGGVGSGLDSGGPGGGAHAPAGSAASRASVYGAAPGSTLHRVQSATETARNVGGKVGAAVGAVAGAGMALATGDGSFITAAAAAGGKLGRFAGGASAGVVLKLGKKGVLLRTEAERHLVEGFTVATVYATGAGDTFDGAFVSQILRGAALVEAARYANAAAALSTTGYGAVKPIPTGEAVRAFLKERA